MSDKHKRGRRRLKQTIAKTAPQIAHALGVPLAGAAVSHLSRALFGTDAVDEVELVDAMVAASPEQLLAIKEADQRFALALREASLADRQIAAADRANARSRQIALQDHMPSVLGAMIILGFFIVLAAMLSRRMPAGAETEFSIMLGALATMTAAVVNYFFGSSAGSKEKTKFMALGGKAESAGDFSDRIE